MTSRLLFSTISFDSFDCYDAIAELQLFHCAIADWFKYVVIVFLQPILSVGVKFVETCGVFREFRHTDITVGGKMFFWLQEGFDFSQI